MIDKKEWQKMEIKKVEYVDGYVLEITFKDKTVKEVDFKFVMQTMADGEFLDMEKFRSAGYTKERIAWGRGEIMVFCNTLYKFKRKVYKGIVLVF